MTAHRPRTIYRGQTSLAAVGRAIEAGAGTVEEIARLYEHDVERVRPAVDELFDRGVVRYVDGRLEFTQVGETWRESDFRALFRSVEHQRRVGPRRRLAA